MILKAQSKVLKVVVLFLIGGLIISAVCCIAAATLGEPIYWPVILAASFSAIAAGLWNLREWARLAVAIFIWLLVIIVPLGVINPFAAMDELGPYPPSAWHLAATVYPWVALGLFVLHVLGKHRNTFVKHNAAQQVAAPDA